MAVLVLPVELAIDGSVDSAANPPVGSYVAYFDTNDNSFKVVDSGGSTYNVSSGSSTPVVYEISGTGTQAMTGSPVVLNLTVENNSNSDFSVSSGVVTYTGATKKFAISYGFSGYNTDNARHGTDSAIYINGSQVLRSKKISYHRNTTNAGGAQFCRIIEELSNGDTIEVRSELENGTSGVQAQLTECTLLFEGY